MAIKTNYNFKGIEVKNAKIKVIRISGNSKEGWSSSVGVYNTTVETVPVTVDKDLKGLIVENEGVVETSVVTKEVEVDKLIDQFNINVAFTEGERGYTSIYKALMDKFGGVEI